MPSQQKLVSTLDNHSRKSVSENRTESPVVELDTTFGRTLGLIEGQKVSTGLCASAS